MLIKTNMSDSREIKDLLTDQQYNEAVHSYVDSQFEFLNDIQMGNYSAGQVTFDSLSLRDKYIHYHDSYIALPLNIKAGTGNIANADIVTVKRAVTDFIYGLTLSTGSGSTIVSDANIVTINHIRLLVETEFHYWQESASQLLFSKDRRAVPSVATFGNISVPDPVEADVSIPAGTNFYANQGFADRANWFKQACTLAANTVSTVVFIPLRHIHDFFMQMDFPIINLRLQMSFLLNMYSNGSVVPALGGRIATNAGSTTAVAKDLAVTVGAATIPGSNIQLTNCRLYYKTVKYHPEVNMQLAQKLAAGFTKSIEFRVTDTYLPSASEQAQTGGSITKLVSPSTIRPLRVWLLACPANALSSSAVPSTTTAATNTGLIPLAVYTGQFTNANILVNNSRYYNNDLVTAADFYNILKEQFPEDQGLVSYSDFLTTYRLHCFDLTRLKDRLKNPNEACSLQINATRVDAVACDYYFVVERLQRVSLHMSSAESSVVVGLTQ